MSTRIEHVVPETPFPVGNERTPEVDVALVGTSASPTRQGDGVARAVLQPV